MGFDGDGVVASGLVEEVALSDCSGLGFEREEEEEEEEEGVGFGDGHGVGGGRERRGCVVVERFKMMVLFILVRELRHLSSLSCFLFK